MTIEEEVDQLREEMAQLRQQVDSRQNVFGGSFYKPTPWAPHNPLSHKFQQNAFPSTKIAVTQEAAFLSGDASTSNTTDIVVALQVGIRVPGGPTCIFAFATYGITHDTGPATYDAHVLLGDNSGSTYALRTISNLALRTSNDILMHTISAGIALPSNIPALINGECTLYLGLKNDTAGNLTIKDGAILHGFVTGDSSE